MNTEYSEDSNPNSRELVQFLCTDMLLFTPFYNMRATDPLLVPNHQLLFVSLRIIDIERFLRTIVVYKIICCTFHFVNLSKLLLSNKKK